MGVDRDACARDGGLGSVPFLVLWVVPIKDSTGRAVKHPILISALSAEDTDDPLDAYWRIRRLWESRVHLVPEAARATTPFFVLPGILRSWTLARCCSSLCRPACSTALGCRA